VTWYQGAGTKTELARRHFESGKGSVAGHLHMLLKDRDVRALGLLLALSRVHAARLLSLIAPHDQTMPPAAILAEFAGNLLGAYSLWKSYRQLKDIDATATS
jgi:hypothetical protein